MFCVVGIGCLWLTFKRKMFNEYQKVLYLKNKCIPVNFSRYNKQVKF